MRSTIVHGKATPGGRPAGARSTSPLRGTLSHEMHGQRRACAWRCRGRAARACRRARSAPSVIVSVTRSAAAIRSTTASGSSAATSASRITVISRASSRSGPARDHRVAPALARRASATVRRRRATPQISQPPASSRVDRLVRAVERAEAEVDDHRVSTGSGGADDLLLRGVGLADVDVLGLTREQERDQRDHRQAGEERRDQPRLAAALRRAAQTEISGEKPATAAPSSREVAKPV